MIRLGVNIDHVATLRNARGEEYPSPIHAAVLAELGGADNITCHLREDRRHIKDDDVEKLRSTIHVPLNFEMAATDEMVAIAENLMPHAVTLVPEKRQELTTEGGLALSENRQSLEKKIDRLRQRGILVSLFVEAEPSAMKLAKDMGAHAVEVHTGHFAEKIRKAPTTAEQWRLIEPLIEVAEIAHQQGLQVHFGHGLNYHNAYWLQAIAFCEEANIGHAIIARSISTGLTKAVREMKDLLNDSRYQPSIKG